MPDPDDRIPLCRELGGPGRIAGQGIGGMPGSTRGWANRRVDGQSGGRRQGLPGSTRGWDESRRREEGDRRRPMERHGQRGTAAAGRVHRAGRFCGTSARRGSAGHRRPASPARRGLRNTAPGSVGRQIPHPCAPALPAHGAGERHRRTRDGGRFRGREQDRRAVITALRLLPLRGRRQELAGISRPAAPAPDAPVPRPPGCRDRPCAARRRG